MYRYERKRIIVTCCIIVLLGWSVLPMMTSLTQLRDPEFAQAVQRAQDMQFPGIDQAVSYPFLPITRAAAAVWYAHSATIAEQSCTDTSTLHAQCNLRDITDLDPATINAIHIACNCNYLR